MNPNRHSTFSAALAALLLAGSALAQEAQTVPTPSPASPAAVSAPPVTAAAASPGVPAARQGSRTPVVTLPPRASFSVSQRSASAANARAFSPGGGALSARGRSAAAGATGDPDDPAYAMYKEAYELILKERWDEARSKFSQLAKKYPDSEYRDDAAYWIAYSWRETDSRKAIEDYKRFLKEYKQSTYFDDALADMDQLMARSMAIAPPGAVSVTPAPPAVFALPADSAFTLTVRSLPVLAPMLKMRHLERMVGNTAPAARLGWAYEDDDIDEGTRLRLETLYAIGMTGEDEKGFMALRNIAVDPKEKKVLRVAAIEGLSEFRKHDILPVFIDIAKNDTSEEMQLFAIDYIGNAAHDKGKAFDALLTLYNSLPPSKVEKRKMVFYSIAEVGNDKAIDFLAGIAKSHEDYELRREAIYYLGSIGGEKARAVLFELVNGK